MSPANIIGIDISKKTLDCHLITVNGEIQTYRLSNTQKAIYGFLAKICKQLSCQKDELLICAEYP